MLFLRHDDYRGPRYATYCVTILMLAILQWSSVAHCAENDEAEHGEASTIKIHRVDSPYQNGTVRIRVLLPDQMESDDRYRCLYVLPVESQDQHRYGDGLAECRRQNLHNRFGLICVAPTFSDLPWYADHPTNRQLRQESHLVRFVLLFVEKHYPVDRSAEGRMLVGFSKSGWGALSMLLRHPNLFGCAAAWDAPLMLESPDKYGTRPIFGTQDNFEQYQISKLLALRAEQLNQKTRLVISGYGNFRDQHARAHALMQQLAIPHVYVDGPERQHDWHSGWLAETVKQLIDIK